MKKNKIKVLQFICPTGFYGAERWILALAKNSDNNLIQNDLAVTYESDDQNLEIVNQFPDSGETHKITMKGRFDLSAISKLVQLIKDKKIDIIHTHGYKSDILGLIAAKKAGIKCVATPHGFGLPEGFKLKFFIKAGGFALRFFDKVVPLSKQLLREVKEYGVAQEKSLYIRNAVDLTEVDEFRAKKTPKKTGKKKQIGFIGLSLSYFLSVAAQGISIVPL